MKTTIRQIILLLAALIWACETEPPIIPEENPHFGLAPVYISEDSIAQIALAPVREASSLGSVSKWEDYLFIRDGRDGYHLVNVSDPASVIKEAFWQIPGTNQLQIVGNLAFVDNFNQLLVIDLNAAPDLQVLSRTPVVDLTDPFLLFPRYYQGYYECHDPDSGIVLEWRGKQELQKPLCHNQEI